MADTPSVTPESVVPEAINDRAAPNPTPDSQTNWLKDLIFPLVLAIGGVITGFGSDVLKHEYELRSTTPRLRRAEMTRAKSTPDGVYHQIISTSFYPVGHPVIPNLMVLARAEDPRVHILNESFKFEPDGQLPQSRQVDAGRPEVMRGLGVANFHEPQKVTWTLEAEAPSDLGGQLVRFDYRGVNDLEDESRVPWSARISLLYVVFALLAYSAIASMFALYFRMKRR